jgi:ABC-type phosphate transport system, permease component
MATLTVTIFQYAMGPYPEWHAQAWAAALVLVAGTLLLFLLARGWMASLKGPQRMS